MIIIKILAINVIVLSELCADMFYGAVSQRSNVANGPPVYIKLRTGFEVYQWTTISK